MVTALSIFLTMTLVSGPVFAGMANDLKRPITAKHRRT